MVKRWRIRSIAGQIEREIISTLIYINVYLFPLKKSIRVYTCRHIYIVMEYCDGGDLSSFIKKKHRLPENICRRFLQQLALALRYLRNHNVCHMDLKPQNLLLMRKPRLVLKVGGWYSYRRKVYFFSRKIRDFFHSNKTRARILDGELLPDRHFRFRFCAVPLEFGTQVRDTWLASLHGTRNAVETQV